MDITRDVSRRVAQTRFAELPAEDVEYAKTLAMSALGAMVAGSAGTGSDIVTRYVKRLGAAGEATVFGAGFRSSVEAAAFANATYAHATEYEDDSFPEAVSSYTIFPPVFALAEHLDAGGTQMLEAFVAGYETQARIGLACREARRLGYMVLSLAGSLGCAAAAARLFGLDEHETTMAISLAASQGAGLGCQTGSMAHIVEMGFAARNGLTAALLAADGFTGQPDVLEAPRGLFEIITAGKVDEPERIVTDWGRPYRIREVGIKQYPCCYHLQRIIEATLEERAAGRIGADRIAEVQVDVNAFFPTVVQHPEPRDAIEAQFSLPHAVAAALLDERVTPASFSRERIDAEDFRRLRSKVRMNVREDWGWAPTGWTPHIVFRLIDGRRVSVDAPRAKGQPPELLGFDECIPKYLACVEPVLSAEAIERSIALLRRLERLPSVRELVETVSS